MTDHLSLLVCYSNEALYILSSVLEDSTPEENISSLHTPPPHQLETPVINYSLPTLLLSKFIKILTNFMNYSFEFLLSKNSSYFLTNSSLILLINIIKSLNKLLKRFCKKDHNFYGIFHYETYIKELNNYYYYLNEINIENKHEYNIFNTKNTINSSNLSKKTITSPNLMKNLLESNILIPDIDTNSSFSLHENSSSGLTQNFLDLSSCSSTDSMQIVTSLDEYEDFNNFSYLTKKFFILINLTEYNFENSSNKFNIINNLNIFSYLFWIKNYDTNFYVSWTKFKKKFELEYGRQTDTTLNTLKQNIEETIYDKQNNTYKNYVSFNKFITFFDDECSIYQSYQEKCDPHTSLILLGSLVDNIIDFPQPTIIKQLLGIKISSISCGDQHIAVVSDSGGLYTWGKGAFGRLGHGSESDILTPCLVKDLIKIFIVKVSCGFAFTGAVSKLGGLYTWGAGMNGRLGHNDCISIYSPKQVDSISSEIVTDVSAGSVHCCILTSNGKLYTCGKADYAGHGTSEDVLQPKLLSVFNDVKVVQISVASGGFHSLALIEDGSLYSWGHNRVGQLGLHSINGFERADDGGICYMKPTKVPFVPRNIVNISAGWGHSCLTSSDGYVMSCGRNAEGQLGLSNPNNLMKNERGHSYTDLFTVANYGDLSLRKFYDAVCGGEHTIFLSGEYDVFGSGLSNKGQLGNGSSSDPSNSLQTHIVPHVFPYFSLEKKKILQVSCGFNSTAILVGKRTPESLRYQCCEKIRQQPKIFNNLRNIKCKNNAEFFHFCNQLNCPYKSQNGEEGIEEENQDQEILCDLLFC